MLNYAYTCFSRSLPPFGVVLLTFTAASTWACGAAHASPSQYENRPATEQPNTGGKDKKIRVAQNTDGFMIDVTIDAKKNQSYIKADDQFSSFVYSATTQNNIKIIQPASKEIMETWKGNKPVSKGGPVCADLPGRRSHKQSCDARAGQEGLSRHQREHQRLATLSSNQQLL
jgi:hypothetical protein